MKERRLYLTFSIRSISFAIPESDPIELNVAYTTPNSILDVLHLPVGEHQHIYINEDKEYLRRANLMHPNNELKFFVDFYVGDQFKFYDSQYIISNGMIYQGPKSNMLVPKGQMSNQKYAHWELNKEAFPLEGDNNLFCRAANNNVFWCGKNSHDPYSSCFSLPEFNRSELQNFKEDTGNNTFQFF